MPLPGARGGLPGGSGLCREEDQDGPDSAGWSSGGGQSSACLRAPGTFGVAESVAGTGPRGQGLRALFSMLIRLDVMPHAVGPTGIPKGANGVIRSVRGKRMETTTPVDY